MTSSLCRRFCSHVSTRSYGKTKVTCADPRGIELDHKPGKVLRKKNRKRLQKQRRNTLGTKLPQKTTNVKDPKYSYTKIKTESCRYTSKDACNRSLAGVNRGSMNCDDKSNHSGQVPPAESVQNDMLATRKSWAIS